jgi:hypothetical protein
MRPEPALSARQQVPEPERRLFTFSVPAAMRICPIVPSSTASTSIVALSVSISAMTLPDLTTSPALTSHLASLPSSIVGDRAGIRIWMGMAWVS